MTLMIRQARETDAPMGVEVLRRSITELCVEDHGNDPAEIFQWLENKTIDTWAAWVTLPDATVYVAERDGILCGVGMVRADGEILLNYVHPDARFQGVSTALLKALEQAGADRGATSISLESTHTARRFYLRNGYTPSERAQPLSLVKPVPAAP